LVARQSFAALSMPSFPVEVRPYTHTSATIFAYITFC